MIVTCEQCQARFKLADEKIKAEGTKVRCSKCQRIFTVFPPPPADEPAAPMAPTGDAEMAAATAAALAPAAPSAPEPAAAEFSFDAGADEGAAPDFAEARQTPEFPASDEPAGFSFSEPAADEDTLPPGEFDFGTSFAMDDGALPSPAAAEEDPFAQDFDETPAAAGSFTADTAAETDAGAFDFSETSRDAAIAAEFAFGEEAAESFGGEFDFSTEVPAATTATAGSEAEPQEFDFSADAAGLDQDDTAWGEPDAGAPEPFDSFDFEEPTFDSQPRAPEGEKASLGFGEIDFSDDEEPLPAFDSGPDFEPPPARPTASPAPLPPPQTAVPPAQPVSRPRSTAQLPVPPPRRSPVSKMVVILVLLLAGLCGAAAYLYVSGDGERLVNQVIMKIKGEKPVGPVVQQIGFSNIVTSYVNNNEAGQLLVVQGVATNNFPTARSAIAVKGLLLDAAGKVVQQQTVYCGNYLSEEKLRTLRYAAIEEAMGNQIGDSLANMNVKPGASLKFTIVFRNVTAEIANISFEAVDSKPGSL